MIRNELSNKKSLNIFEKIEESLEKLNENGNNDRATKK